MTPQIEDYSKELQAAAAEMKAIPGPCPRDTLNVSDCSALKRLVIDYGDLRQRIRGAREKKLMSTTGPRTRLRPMRCRSRRSESGIWRNVFQVKA